MNKECVKKLQLLPTLFAGVRVHSNKSKLSKKKLKLVGEERAVVL